ncbi:MAG: ABC transporter permease subunit [Zavarzinella sp.]
MKTLEILKDSLREAWDSMVLFIMLILIGVFLLIVSSIGFQPVTAEVAFKDFSSSLQRQPLAMERGEQILLQRPSGYSTKIENIKSQDSNRPQFSAHEFDLIITNDVSTERIPNPNVKKDPTVDEPLFVEVTKEVPAIQKIVGLWHYDGKSDYIEIPENSSITLDNIVVKKPLTEEMYQAYFKWLIEKQLTAPVKELSVNTSNLPKSMQLSVKVDPVKAPLEWPVGLSIGFGLYENADSGFPLGEVLFQFDKYVINSMAGMFIIGMGLVITSFFIPNTLRKGTIDLYLSKPINRTAFLVVKYLGGSFFVLILATTLVGGTYLITGLHWHLGP